MNQFKRFSIVSVVVFFFWALNVSCLRGSNDSGNNTVAPEIRSHNELPDDDLIVSNIEKQGEDIANHLVDGIVSALEQSANASFLEGAASFNFKEEAKTHAKMILREMLKGGLEPLELVVAESIKPPTIPSNIYKTVKPVIAGVFNKAEHALKVNISDDIWEYDDVESSSRSAQNESEDESDEEEGSGDEDDDIDF